MITAYLTDGSRLANPHVVVKERSQPLVSDAPRTGVGSQPIDGGHLIIKGREEFDRFVKEEPGAEKWLRPYIGADEYLDRRDRWIIAVQNASPDVLASLPLVKQRLAKVRDFRSSRTRKGTLQLASTPAQWQINCLPTAPFLIIPLHTLEDRSYVPMGFLSPPAVPSNATLFVEQAKLWQFAVLTSRMHMAWLWYIGGTLESRVRYSKGIVYNNFPWPTVDDAAKARLERMAQAILSAREALSTSTPAQMYDPLFVSKDLQAAHAAVDRAVDRLYRPEPFTGDAVRAEFLLGLYERLEAPLAALAAESKWKRKKAH